MADEVGYLVVEDVEVGYGVCNLITPIPTFPRRGGRSVFCSPHPSPLPKGEGTLNGGFVLALPLWIPACAGKTVRGGFAVGVGEAVLEEVLCGFEAVVDFDAGGFALHCFREEARDVFTVFGETDDVLL